MEKTAGNGRNRNGLGQHYGVCTDVPMHSEMLLLQYSIGRTHSKGKKSKKRTKQGQIKCQGLGNSHCIYIGRFDLDREEGFNLPFFSAQ